MKSYLLKYQISPRVVRGNQKQKIEIKGLDESCKFFDDIEYLVKITTIDGWKFKEKSSFMMGERNCNTEIICQPLNGIISFEYFFSGEYEWHIEISRMETEKHIPQRYKKYWPRLINRLYDAIEFSIYSLEDDLYGKRPYKGDLHIHTYESDGCESPAMVAAQYRKWGYDFISITDHLVLEPSLEAIKKFEDIDTEFKIFPGEEVHPIPGSIFHIVNFNAGASVNALVHSNPEKAAHEVEKISVELDIEDETDRKTVAWYKWVCESIRKCGGIAIYPHPYWIVGGTLSVNSRISEEIFKHGLCDVFEAIGGVEKNQNKMQVQLNYEMRDRGYKLPIVASSDSHSSLTHGVSRFDQAWTIAFSENAENIPENILNGMTVAVENFEPSDKNVYGELRLVKYAWFLIENYYELHDAYCNASGQAILRYVFGDTSQKTLISALENELKKFDEGFFSHEELQ